MKKHSLLFLFVSFYTGILFAGNKINFSISPDAGVLFGNVNEYVYYVPAAENGSSETRKLSELNWDVYFMPYMGARFDCDFDFGLFVNTGFRVGVPGSSGTMVDRDWQNVYLHYDKNYLTNYSIHENYLTGYYKIDFSLGQKFNMPYGFSVSPELFVNTEKFYFYGANGYGKYGTGNGFAVDGYVIGPYEKGNDKIFEDKVISYDQSRIFFGLGLQIEKEFESGLLLSAFGKVRFAIVEAEDHHLIRDWKFLDKPYGFGGLLAGGNICYKFNAHHSIRLSGSYDWLPLILGSDYYASEYSELWSFSNVVNSKNEYLGYVLGGASSTLVSASLSYTFTF